VTAPSDDRWDGSGTIGPWDYRPKVLRYLLIALFTLSAAALHAQEPAQLKIAQLDLGFGGVYKLGCWTQAAVTLEGGDAAYTGAVEITTRDPEGVPNTVVTPPHRPVGVAPNDSATARLFVRPGQDGAALEVRFIDDTGRVRARRTFYPGPEPGGDYIPYGRPAANRLIASFGSTRGLGDLTRGDATSNEFTATRAVIVPAAADLPLRWYGYEGIDTLVLSGSQAEMYRPLAANPQRIEAIARWVELGGRLVIFCGVNAPELIGPGGPLESLVPGRFDALVTLRQWQPIESFTGAASSIADGDEARVQAPRLVDVEGRILAFDGPQETDLPLVVRARRGFGEITFVAVDPDVAPLADWSTRASLLRQSLGWPPEAAAAAEGAYVDMQQELIDHLRRRLDESFIGVQPASFGLVALLVVLYILLIGPGDYFFVKRVLKRMELTWLTFPLIVLGVSLAAYWAAYAMKGDQLRVNQVEVVDVDVGAGQARGTVWTHFFSPRVERYDLALAPRFAEQPIAGASDPSAGSEPGRPGPGGEQLVAWLGSSGYGLDGMQGRRGQTGLFDRGYQFSPQLDALVGLPVQEWSTRTLVGRWSGPAAQTIEAELQNLDEGLLAGHVTNRSGMALEECVLLHANWAYVLPSLAEGGVATIDDSLQPRSVKTALTGGDPSLGDAAPPLDPLHASVEGLARAMMFHEALGGAGYAQAPSRYQSYVDFSRLLRGDQAIMLARAPAAAGSHWTNGDAPLASDQDRRWVYYRFIIPLKESGE
jgi:hypothetical protein